MPGVTLMRRAEYERLLRNYPSDFASPATGYAPSLRVKGSEGRKGSYTDAWGCTFTAKGEGVVGEVKKPLFRDDWKGLKEYEPPWELLNGIDEKKGSDCIGMCRGGSLCAGGNSYTSL